MRVYLLFLFLLASAATGLTQKSDDKSGASHDDAAALTIYNQSFAVVRQTLPLDLKSGTNQFEITDITAHLEPDSVILRDLKSGRDLRILEQNYRSDVASQGRLLALYEGKTIEFLVPDKDGNRRLVRERSSAADTLRTTRHTAHTISSITRRSRPMWPPATANRSLRSTANC